MVQCGFATCQSRSENMARNDFVLIRVEAEGWRSYGLVGPCCSPGSAFRTREICKRPVYFYERLPATTQGKQSSAICVPPWGYRRTS